VNFHGQSGAETLEHQVTRSTYVAQTISKFTSPTILSVIILLLIAFTKSKNLSESIEWVAIILLFFVFIPVVYVLVKTSRSGNQTKSLVELNKFLKQHPADILILALSLGLPCLLILRFFEAPAILISTIVALLAGSIVTSLFNLFYRVSFHLTGITVLIIMAAQTWGRPYLFLLLAIPLISWAKFKIRDHTIPQLIIGTIVAVAVSFGALQLGFLKP
jgi:hypothetical protein